MTVDWAMVGGEGEACLHCGKVIPLSELRKQRVPEAAGEIELPEDAEGTGTEREDDADGNEEDYEELRLDFSRPAEEAGGDDGADDTATVGVRADREAEHEAEGDSEGGSDNAAEDGIGIDGDARRGEVGNEVDAVDQGEAIEAEGSGAAGSAAGAGVVVVPSASSADRRAAREERLLRTVRDAGLEKEQRLGAGHPAEGTAPGDPQRAVIPPRKATPRAEARVVIAPASGKSGPAASSPSAPAKEKKPFVAVKNTPGTVKEPKEGPWDDWQAAHPKAAPAGKRDGLGRLMVTGGGLAVVLVLAGLVYLGFLAKSQMSKETAARAEAAASATAAAASAAKGETETGGAPHDDAQRDEADMRAVLDRFFRAGTIGGKATAVRHPEETLPRMSRYYEDEGEGGPAAQEYALVEGTIVREDGAKSFLFAVLDVTGEGRRSIALERTGDGLKIDWESYVGYSPVLWAHFVATAPEGEIEFRVRARKDDYYNYEFSDEDAYACYRLVDLGQTDYCFGYIRREGPDFEKLKAAVEKAAELGAADTALTLRLEFPPGGAGRRQVLIRGFVRDNWLER